MNAATDHPNRTTPASKPSRKRASRSRATKLNAAERYRLIAERAYLIAAEHGFDASRSLDDWLEAETQIDAMLHAEGTSP
jgi:hypothetical protein